MEEDMDEDTLHALALSMQEVQRSLCFYAAPWVLHPLVTVSRVSYTFSPACLTNLLQWDGDQQGDAFQAQPAAGMG